MFDRNRAAGLTGDHRPVRRRKAALTWTALATLGLAVAGPASAGGRHHDGHRHGAYCSHARGHHAYGDHLRYHRGHFRPRQVLHHLGLGLLFAPLEIHLGGSEVRRHRGSDHRRDRHR